MNNAIIFNSFFFFLSLEACSHQHNDETSLFWYVYKKKWLSSGNWTFYIIDIVTCLMTEYEYFHFYLSSSLLCLWYLKKKIRIESKSTYTKMKHEFNFAVTYSLLLFRISLFPQRFCTHTYAILYSFVSYWETINYEYIDSIDTFVRLA